MCGLRLPEYMSREKNFEHSSATIEQREQKSMKNEMNIYQYLSTDNHIGNGASLLASTYNRLVSAERHAIFESFRMVLL